MTMDLLLPTLVVAFLFGLANGKNHNLLGSLDSFRVGRLAPKQKIVVFRLMLYKVAKSILESSYGKIHKP
jgi:hypothetical protein